jgi:hypothetical protein
MIAMTADELAITMSKAIAKPNKVDALLTLSAACVALLQRLGQLEARPTLKYVGVYEDGAKYVPGEFVTYSGSLWYCERATTSKPGGSACWRLSVKQGSLANDPD